jgi:hypothetical protein
MLLISMPTGALAQDTAAALKTVKTQKVTAADSFVERPLVDLAPDGVPLIDWVLAEELADGTVEQERTTMARLMLAIRDGKWRPMPNAKPLR